MHKTLIAATLLGSALLMAAPASAAVVPRPEVATGKLPTVEVQMRRDHDHDRRRWVPGRRYDGPPRGWRRYGARPRDWRTRGCIIVGPVWFCP